MTKGDEVDPSGAELPKRAQKAAQGASLYLIITADSIPQVADQAVPDGCDGNSSTWICPPAYDHLLDQWNSPAPDPSDIEDLSLFLREVTRMMTMGFGSWEPVESVLT